MKKFFRNSLLTVALASVTALTADDLSIGNKAFFAGDYRNAVRCYEDHLKKSAAAGNQQAWIKGVQNLAAAYIFDGETAKARELFNEFRRKYPKHAAGSFEGMLLAAEKRYAEAEKVLQALKTTDPESEDARQFILATVYLQTGRVLEAYQLFAEISGAIGKTYSPNAVSGAVEALKSGRMNEAQRLIGRLAARPESPWKFFAASESVYALIRLNKIDEAFTVLAEIPRDKYTFNTELLRYLAEAHRGEVGNFKKNFRQFMEKMPRRPGERVQELFSCAADAAVKNGDREFAASLLRNALAVTDDAALKRFFTRKLIAVLSVSEPENAVNVMLAYFNTSGDPGKLAMANETAAVLYNNKAYRPAMKLYSFIYEQSQDINAVLNAVNCAEMLRDFAELEKFNRILFAKSPGKVEFYLRYADFLEKYEKFDLAEMELLTAVDTAEKSGNVKLADKLKFLAMEFYLRRGDEKKIRNAAARLEKSADKNYVSAAKLVIGGVLEKNGFFHAAKKYYTDTEALGTEKYAPQASFKAALISYHECSFEIAAEEFFSCARKYPRYEKAAEALFMAFSLYDLYGSKVQAQTAGELLRSNYSKHDAFAVFILDQTARNGAVLPLEKLLPDLETVEKNFPESDYSAEARLLRGTLTANAGKQNEALEILQGLAGHRNKFIAGESLLRSGEILFSQSKFSEAEKLFRQSAAIEPGSRGSDIAVIRAADCIMADKIPQNKAQIEKCITELTGLAGKSRFPLIRLEAAYKAAHALRLNGSSQEAAAIFEKNIYFAADMYDRGVDIGSSWCVKSCEAALEMITPGDRGGLAKGIRLIEECEKILPDQDLSRMKQNFRNKMSKKRR